VIAIIFATGLIALAIWVRHRRQYDIIAEILSERENGQKKVIFDKAAIIKDKKTGKRYFRLLRINEEYPVPPYNVLVPTDKGDMVRIWRKSDAEFVFLTQPSINEKYIVKHDGKEYRIGNENFRQLEGDVLNWLIKKRESNKTLFDREGLLMKLVPYIPHILALVGLIFVLYLILDTTPTILGQMNELAKTLTEVAQEIRAIRGAEVTV